MNAQNTVGFFGKLPAHGDFIYRDLPSNFINIWDAWLQSFVGSSKENMGESWLDIYLTSPIWRFAFSEGVVDQFAWAGILLPSVDRVGRYFPFSIATRLPASANPMQIISQVEWFERMEAAALQALNGQVLIDDLLRLINREPLVSSSFYSLTASKTNSVGTVIKQTIDDQSPHAAFSHLLDASLRETLSSYSVWNTLGSDYVEPCLFHARGLPPMRGIAAMLDGQWEQWGWHEPYRIKQAV